MGMTSTETSVSLQKWHQGDRDGLTALLDRHLSWIHARVRRRLGSRLRRMVESTDIVQDAAVEFLRYGPRFLLSDDGQFRRLLARIIENVLRDKHDWYTARRRDMARARPIPPTTVLALDPGLGEVDTPSKALQEGEEEAWIRLGMELLDPDDREVIILRQWDELSFVDIGRRLKISRRAAWMRHSRAVQRLSTKIGGLRRRDRVDLVGDGDDPASEEPYAAE